jgi:hypothetical protein
MARAGARKLVKKMMTELREGFPDLNFWGVGELIAEGDYVAGRWDGGGTHTGPAFDHLPVGKLPAASGRNAFSLVRPSSASPTVRSARRTRSTH